MGDSSLKENFKVVTLNLQFLGICIPSFIFLIWCTTYLSLFLIFSAGMMSALGSYYVKYIRTQPYRQDMVRVALLLLIVGGFYQAITKHNYYLNLSLVGYIGIILGLKLFSYLYD